MSQLTLTTDKTADAGANAVIYLDQHANICDLIFYPLSETVNFDIVAVFYFTAGVRLEKNKR